MPEISVIVPCYNTDIDMLKRCINSILIQTYSDFEIIIVDDGSKEEYKKVYNELSENDKIKVMFKENGGVSSARNYGIEYSTGKYITFVDSDDKLTPFFLEEAYKIGCKNDADLVIGYNIHLSDYNKKSLYPKEIEDDEITTFISGEIHKLKPYMVGKRLNFNNGINYIGRGPWTRLIKAEIAKQVFFDTSLSICEDIVWNLQVLEKCKKVCCVEKVWYVYNNMQNETATRGYNDKIVFQSQKGLLEIRNNLDLNINEEYKAFCERCLEDISTISRRFINHENCPLSKEEKKRLCLKVYTEEPWSMLGSMRFFRLADRKNKLKLILYKKKILFEFYKILLLLSLNRNKVKK